MGLTVPDVGGAGQKKKPEHRVLFTCEALAALRHHHLGFIILDPEDVRNRSLGQSGTVLKGQGSHDLEFGLGGTKSLLWPTCFGTERAPSFIHSFIQSFIVYPYILTFSFILVMKYRFLCLFL